MSNLHLSECQLLSQRKNLKDDFKDFDVIAAFRFLSFKKAKPDTYNKLKSLCSNLDAKV